MTFLTRELSDIFVARFVELAPEESHSIAGIRQSACIQSRWQYSSRANKIVEASIRARFGDSVIQRKNDCAYATVRFNAAYRAAQAWSIPLKESVMNWPGLAAEPEDPAIVEDPQPSLEERVQRLEQQIHALCDQSARYHRALEYSHSVYQVQGKAFFKACDLLHELRDVAVDLCSVSSPMETNFCRLLEEDWQP